MDTKLLPETTSASLINAVHHADLFDLCERVARAGVRVDCILADLPYGTTACAWDTIIPFEPMWAAFKRIIKPRGAIVLTASQPFTSVLVCSNLEMFKYAWTWVKTMATGHMHAKNKPLKRHEDILVFSHGVTIHESQSDSRMAYYPQLVNGAPYKKTQRSHGAGYLHAPSEVNIKFIGTTSINDGERYPTSVIEIANPNNDSLHPTQKPVDLFRYLIRTYTRPGELVFDPCVGSGTTAVAAREEGRRYIVGDSSSEYVQVARDRLALPFTPSFLPALDAASA